MSLNGRTHSRSVPKMTGAKLEPRHHEDAECAAGTSLIFVVERPGRFTAWRFGCLVGGIDLKPGGWVAYERTFNGCRWTPHGRIRAYFAARDLWGREAGAAVAKLPENRPVSSDDDGLTKNWRRSERAQKIEGDHVAT